MSRIKYWNNVSNSWEYADDIITSGGGAVESVNGQTGAVVLTASDVGAATPGQLDEAKHTTMVVTAMQEGSGGYKADHTSTEIINHSNGGGIVVLRYTEGTGRTLEIRMSGQTDSREAWFYQTFKVPGANIIKRVDVIIDWEGNVSIKEEPIIVATTEDINGFLTQAEVQQTVEKDNTKPVSSAAVYTVVGNVETLLSKI